jgi:hypothetical protein
MKFVVIAVHKSIIHLDFFCLLPKKKKANPTATCLTISISERTSRGSKDKRAH